MKILWASPNTLLDTTSGAALAVREILKQLRTRGCEVRILGGTIVVNPNGAAPFVGLQPKLKDHLGKFVVLQDGSLAHRLLVTQRMQRRLMLSYEEKIWFDEYCRMLDEFKPDMVWFFDNSLMTLLTADEARRRGVPAVVYLAHANNRGTRWCRDVSLMLTDSQATAKLYQEREGYDLVVIGTFIQPVAYKATNQSRAHVLFINPTPEKGVVFVIQLALLLERQRPDIRLEVVESRSKWVEALRSVTRGLGCERDALANVMLTPNTQDMRPVYGRARALLVPSVWWESGARVIVEAMLNGIPVIGSNSGGIPEIMGQGGHVLHFPPGHLLPPYDKLFDAALLNSAAALIVLMYDDQGFYDTCVQSAYKAHAERHDIEKNTDLLMQVLNDTLTQTSLPEPYREHR